MVPPHERHRTPAQMTEPVRERLRSIAGITTVIGAAGGLGGLSKPIQVNVFGDDLAVLGRIADDLVEKMSQIKGLADIESSLKAAQPVIGIRVNREAASDLGISLQQIGDTLKPLLGGQKVSDWTSPDGKTFDVVVRLPEDARNSVETLETLPISQSGATGSSSIIRLEQVANIVQSVGPGEILREDLSRQVGVSANVSDRPLGEVTAELTKVVNSINVPTGYRISMGGDSEQLADTASAAGSALLLAVIFIYLVLASQFGSFIQPLAIMVSLPLSIIGVLIGLLVAGTTLNMFSAIGFIMLMGLVVKNAILLVDNANKHHAEGMPLVDALIEAGGTRFRPIIMTTLAMVFGMMPLALGIQEGSSQTAPMAHAVIGGLISSTMLTLVVVPVILTYLDSVGQFFTRILPSAPDEAHAVKPAE
jgi:HAE1 family hydrophobic/amphiphilic exporter-1